MSAVNQERIKRIEKRWTDDRKVSGADVDWLIARAKAADTMDSANDLRRASSGDSGLGDLLDKMFGGRL